MVSTASPTIRPATDADDLGGLISSCFAEYPGCVFDRAQEMPELDAIASHFRSLDGHIWVATVDDAIVGSLGVRPLNDGALELLKVYVSQTTRGTGLAQQLLERALDLARTRGAPRLELWSDTRFERGHGFYRKHGFVATGERRFLADLSDTWEYRFVRDLDADTRH